jgi:hypothetical protein
MGKATGSGRFYVRREGRGVVHAYTVYDRYGVPIDVSACGHARWGQHTPAPHLDLPLCGHCIKQTRGEAWREWTGMGDAALAAWWVAERTRVRVEASPGYQVGYNAARRRVADAVSNVRSMRVVLSAHAWLEEGIDWDEWFAMPFLGRD